MIKVVQGAGRKNLQESVLNPVLIFISFIIHIQMTAQDQQESKPQIPALPKPNKPIKDFQPKSYKSKTQEATVAEIKAQELQNSRPLFNIMFVKKRKDLGVVPRKLNDAQSDKLGEFKVAPQLTKLHEKKMVIQIGLQGGNPYTSNGAQTNWKRKINKGIQLDDISRAATLDDQSGQLLKFLDNVYPAMEQALQSNQTIDIFMNDFVVMPDDQSNNATEITNAIRQTKILFFLSCKQKRISCVQFYPKLKGKEQPIIAESFMENLSFQNRITFSMKSSKSFILFWNYQDIHSIDPVLILTCPLQVLCFEFNPKNPKILVCGAINGQIFLYDLSNLVSDDIGKKPIKQKKAGQTIEIKPTLISALQDLNSQHQVIRKNVPSHRSPVMSIHWMPPQIEFDRKNLYNLLHVPNQGEINQFVSVGSDGQLLFWDRQQQDSSKKAAAATDQAIPWKAVFGTQISRPEGVSGMGVSHFSFRKKQKTATLTGASDQGQVFVMDWTIKPQQGKTDNMLFYWDKQRSYRPVVALDVSPFFQDIILTVHDYNFSIWKHGVDVPFFQSMIIAKQAYITCGCWSRTRPGVIFIGRSDGYLDIWDFLDQSHKCTIQYRVTTIGLSCIKFHPYSFNVLAVGDNEGNLHILELSFTLSKQIGEEEKTMSQYWKREIERVNYFAKRFEIRIEQNNKKLKDQEKERGDIDNRKEEKKDQDSKFQKEYEQFVKSFFAQLNGTPLEDKEKQKAKK